MLTRSGGGSKGSRTVRYRRGWRAEGYRCTAYSALNLRTMYFIFIPRSCSSCRIASATRHILHLAQALQGMEWYAQRSSRSTSTPSTYGQHSAARGRFRSTWSQSSPCRRARPKSACKQRPLVPFGRPEAASRSPDVLDSTAGRRRSIS